jgi:hypothetical protein
MVPLSLCSLRNFLSSSCSDCDSRMLQLMSDAGAPGLRSIAWSQGRGGGNFFDSSSLNTCLCLRYCGGIMLVGVWIVVDPMMVWEWGLICRGRNHALAASAALSTIGSWSWVIHPLLQSIFGWAAVNYGYPRITLFSPRSERKYRSVRCAVPVHV